MQIFTKNNYIYKYILGKVQLSIIIFETKCFYLYFS